MECCILTGIQMGTHHKRTGSDMLFEESWKIHNKILTRKQNINATKIVKNMRTNVTLVEGTWQDHFAFNVNLRSYSVDNRFICQPVFVFTRKLLISLHVSQHILN